MSRSLPSTTTRLSQRYPVFKSLAKFTAATYLSQLLFLLRGFVLAHLLGPTTFGLWRMIKLVLLYLPQLAGTGLEAMRRELPFAIGAKDTAREKIVVQAIYAVHVGLASVLFIVCLVGAILGPTLAFSVPRWIWMALAGIVPLRILYDFYYVKLQCEEQVSNYSTVSLINAVLICCLMISGALLNGLEGALVGLFFGYGLSLAWVILRHGMIPVHFFERQILQPLLNTGFPIWLSLGGVLLLRDIDQWLIAAFRGPKDLGYYGIAVFFVNLLHFIPGIYRIVMQPSLLREVASTNSIQSSSRVFEKSFLLLAFGAPLVIAILFVVADPIISFALPAYKSSITVTKVYLISNFWRMIVPVSYMICIAANKRSGWVRNTAIVIGLHCLTTSLLLCVGQPLPVIAASTSIIYAIYTALQMRLVYSFFKENSDWKSLFLKGMVPFFTLCVLGALFYSPTYMNSIIFMVGVILSFWMANKRWDMLEVLRRKHFESESEPSPSASVDP